MDMYSFALDLRKSLLKSKATIYSNKIIKEGAPLEQCKSFTDFTNIKICRPGGLLSAQRSVYFDIEQ